MATARSFTKEKNEVFRETVKGLAYYAEVHEPHNGGDAHDKYRIKLVFTNPNSNPELQKLEKYLRQTKAASSIFDETDMKTGELTGNKGIMLRARAFRDEAGNIQNPMIVLDEYGDDLSSGTLIGNGSEVEVALESYTSKDRRSGKTLTNIKFVGVQVLKLVPYERTSGGGHKDADIRAMFSKKPSPDTPF